MDFDLKLIALATILWSLLLFLIYPVIVIWLINQVFLTTIVYNISTAIFIYLLTFGLYLIFRK
jgi:hypothetical protein